MTIIADEEAVKVNDELLSHVMSKGYTETSEYIKNCGSCGEFGLFYASEYEVVNFVDGSFTPDLSSDYFMQNSYFKSIEDANYNFDSAKDKVITNGILFKRNKDSKKFEAAGIFSLPREGNR